MSDVTLTQRLVAQYQALSTNLKSAVADASDADVVAWIADQITEVEGELGELADLLDDLAEDAADGGADENAEYDDICETTDGKFAVIDWFTGDAIHTVGTKRVAVIMRDSLLARGLITDAALSADEMHKLGANGQAFHKKNGMWAYPTPTLEYWHMAQQAFGRSDPAERGALKSYLVRRGNALNAPKEEVARISEYSSN